MPEPIRTKSTLIEERFRARSGESQDVLIVEIELPTGFLTADRIATALPGLVIAMPMLTAKFESPRPWSRAAGARVSGQLDADDCLSVHPPDVCLDDLHVQLTQRHGRIEENKLWSCHFIPGPVTDCLLLAVNHVICDGPSMARLFATLLYLAEGGELPGDLDSRALIEERHAVLDAALTYGHRPGPKLDGSPTRFPSRYQESGWGVLGSAVASLDGVVSQARALDCSVNEYTLTAISLAISRWLTDVGPGASQAARSGGAVVVRFPVDLRPADKPGLGFGIAVGYADAVTHPFGATFADVLSEVRASIAQQPEVMAKNIQRQFAVPSLARFLGSAPEVARPALFSLGGDSNVTAWLSNMGYVDNGVANRVVGLRTGMLRRDPSPPLIVIGGMGSKLQISGSLPADVANAKEANDFFQLFARICEGGQ